MQTKDPGAHGARVLVSSCRKLLTLVGARKGAIQHVWTGVAIVIVAEQAAVALEVVEPLPGLGGGLVENDPIAFDPVDHRAAEQMVASIVAVALGEDDAVASNMVDGADLFLVRSNHAHMFTDLAEQLPLSLTLAAPVAEVAFEAVLVLAAIVVIVAIELVELALPPFAIVRVVDPADCRGRAARALRRPAVLRPAVRRTAPIEPVVAAEAASAEETAGVGAAIAFVAEPCLAVIPRGFVIAGEAALAPSAFFVEAARIFVPAAFGLIVAKPTGYFVSGPFKETAFVFAMAEIVAKPATRLAPASAALIPVISHGNSSLFKQVRPLFVVRKFNDWRRAPFRSGAAVDAEPKGASAGVKKELGKALPEGESAAIGAPTVRRGAVAQMGERCNRTAEVRGSIPLSSTSRLSNFGIFGEKAIRSRQGTCAPDMASAPG